jgi:hypothetical protein
MKNFKLLYLLILSIFITSCEDESWLADAEVPSNFISTDYTSNLDLDAFTRGAYFNLGTPGGANSFGTRDMLLFQDMQSDIVKQLRGLTIAGNFNAQPIYQRQEEINDIGLIIDTWGGGYTMLNNANRVIEFYSDNEPFDDGYSHWAPVLMGESYFLRAFAHYMLATTFAPPYSSDPGAESIILQIDLPQGATDLNGLSTNQEVYEQIVSDLKQAIDLLPESYDLSLFREDFQDRLTRAAARFMLARVYFLMGSEFWTTGFNGDGGALEQINTLIASGDYPLYQGDNLRDIFTPRGLGQKVPETVWYVAYYFRNAWRAPANNRFYGDFSGTGNFRNFPLSKSTLEYIGWDNITSASEDERYNDLFRRYEKDGSGPAGTDRLSNIYEDDYQVWTTKFTDRTLNFIVMRSAELYLMRAVIRLANNDVAGATSDVNEIRSRAGLADLASVNQTDIDKEWIKEFAFEGKRLFYLQATKQDVGPGDREGASAIPYDDPSLVRRIPFTELTRNPNLGE